LIKKRSLPERENGRDAIKGGEQNIISQSEETNVSEVKNAVD
jgi:hypothetical protein